MSPILFKSSLPQISRQQRQEYSRLRSIATNRVKRISEKYPESKIALEYKSFAPISQMKTPKDFGYAMMRVKNFLEQPTTLTEYRATLEGKYEKIAKDWRNAGYEKVSRTMAETLNRIDEILRAHNLDKIFYAYDVYDELFGDEENGDENSYKLSSRELENKVLTYISDLEKRQREGRKNVLKNGSSYESAKNIFNSRNNNKR